MAGQTDFDVLVIGAGAAGLAAARQLAAAGKKIAILEARDRIGFHKTWVQPRLQRVVKELYGRNIVTIKDDAIAVSQGEWRLRASSDRQN